MVKVPGQDTEQKGINDEPAIDLAQRPNICVGADVRKAKTCMEGGTRRGKDTFEGESHVTSRSGNTHTPLSRSPALALPKSVRPLENKIGGKKAKI